LYECNIHCLQTNFLSRKIKILSDWWEHTESHWKIKKDLCSAFQNEQSPSQHGL